MPSPFFTAAAGFPPLPFQLAWMEQEQPPAAIRTLEAPTGLGKTLATLVGWLWDRQQQPAATPRRLVYQLPLRTLTDQIAAECRAVIARLGAEIPVFVLRGGQIENDYIHALAQEAVIVGTLDQVVSRQLMRGYCCSRWSWPRHFAALNTDVRVVVDETQLQGAAVRTAIRLQQLHQEHGGPWPRELVLCSATLDPTLLPAGTPRFSLGEKDYEHPVAQRKVGRPKPLTLAGDSDPVDLVRQEHQQGTLTLVVANTVKRAQTIHDGLIGLPRLLLHSRFRRAERQSIEAQLSGFRGVVMATQTVEAGVDLDARLLVTDLCPWASFVQRCGRVGRNATYADATVIVLEPEMALPYEEAELEDTRQRLAGLNDVAVRELMGVEAPPQPGEGERLTANTFTQLFDTHPLEQGDIDIAPYLRVGEMRDASLLWRESLGPSMPPATDQELCPVPLRALQQRFPMVWSPRGDGWAEIPSAQLQVGSVAAVACSAGGYDLQQGWQPTSTTAVPEVAIEASRLEPEDRSSFGVSVPVTLPQHLNDAWEEAEALCQALAIPSPMAELVIRSAWLHDIGKAHPVFQGTMRANGCGEGQWAKAPGWGSRHSRPGFRHEVASALAALHLGEEDLITYLLMSHHGKVRLRLEPFPWQNRDGPLHGVIAGEELPAVEGVSPATTLPYPPRGLGKGWAPMARHLLRSHGPFRLAALEAVIREADFRASRRWQVPPPTTPCT
ncbi:DEAD/DEAH box helicase [Synechococcus sp. CS-205]|uniref:DEAD/DEAH box helicase n=1 Tax=Synechococcus sp. CS-205 TaxID=2847984 RepID=UPI00223A7E2D|nr:DEAD/DEAH box helicase [Synechococcus sp. CS-205]